MGMEKKEKPMNDQHIYTNIECPYCYGMNEDVLYSESANIHARLCEHCNKEFEIILEFKAKPIWDGLLLNAEEAK